jgi:cation diffusion facilitator CzcD-associated flavoprotein CzcO
VPDDAIIVGAGPAGLAVGACLARSGVSATILEQSTRVGAAWHRHYARLHLHTDKTRSQLPFAAFAAECPRYPSRQQVIDYLQSYARTFRLDIRLGQQVVEARPLDGGWEVRSQDHRYLSRNLVLATGYNREPNRPTWPGQPSFRGPVLHSSDYRDGQPFRGRRVLVVGFGNSGGEIAIDLCEHGAEPSIAIRGPVNVVPRELFGIPIQAVSLVQSRLPPRVADMVSRPMLRLVMGDLSRLGLEKGSEGPMTQIRRRGRIPLIDVGTIALIRDGRIAVCPGVKSFTADGVVFTDGTQRALDAVILATGYRPRVDAFLNGASAALDGDGAPASSGRETVVSGLYFCGFRVSAAGMLREIGREARRISAAIARRAGAVGVRVAGP